MRVAILTPLHDVSRPDLADTFVQADEIAAALDRLGHDAFPAVYTVPQRTATTLLALAPDIVFNLVEDAPEGLAGVHRAAALVEGLGLPLTGASTATLAALGDKRAMKRALTAMGLPVAPSPTDETTRVIVKSATEHASIGLSAANVVVGSTAAETLVSRLEAEPGGVWFAEAYVDGREFNVAILEQAMGPRVLPIAEIAFEGYREDEPRILGYAAKWDTGSAAYARTPRRFPPREEALFAELERLAIAAWRCFDLSGYARVDFRVAPEGSPIILEVNANPCLAADAGFCAAAAVVGLSQDDVVASLLDAAR